ncbi:cytochrome P450 hydroxylase [Longimycelium tulufanense]|uniref:Cytochrome P450 hydroxylase n=1 Tax=Longimycelium tulufanense TaxID=907463 RepID=A0A8J3C9U5_9PSEU|nr:cytochrome P450 [Longimycelium tulufanense]GGM36851.1 cytochrome P450 hydroxylase [Longimycelium tulufanense]
MSTAAQTSSSSGNVPFLDVTASGFTFDRPQVAVAREQNWWAETPVGPLVLRYAEVQELLRDSRLVQNGRAFLERNDVTGGLVHDWFVQLILHRHGVDHARLRQLVSKSFTPRVSRELRPFIRTAAERLAERLATTDVCDFVDMFADPLPVTVMCRLLGVPAEDYDTFRRWSSNIGLVFGLDHDRGLLPRVEESVTGLYGYVAELVRRREDEPKDDLISDLLRAQRDENTISTDELLNLVVTLIFAAHDTTRHQLAHAMVAFSKYPEQWAVLRERPELAAQTVEEVMRWCPSVPVIFRVAAQDVDYHGLHLPAGTFLMLCVQSAQRDPRVFADGDAFDITVTREAAHLTFGAGPHFCLGAATARTELAEALPALASRLGPPTIAGPVTWRHPIGVSGPDALPLRFG